MNLTVKNATLQDSLDQFVKGELLEGDNAYFCEKCGEKVSVNLYSYLSAYMYWSARLSCVITQEPLTTPVAVSVSPALADFLSGCICEGLPATCGWLWNSLWSCLLFLPP